MQHELMRQPAPVYGSDNVGDVLASIRRLIAQDEAASPIPNQMLNTLPRDPVAGMDGAAADRAPGPWAMDAQDTAPETPAAAEAMAEPLPLILNTSDLITPYFPVATAQAEVETLAVPAAEPELVEAPPSVAEPEASALPEQPVTEAAVIAAMEGEPAIEAQPAETRLAMDTAPEAVEPEPPEVTLWSQAAQRLDFNLQALWADPIEPETTPAPDMALADNSGEYIPGLSTDDASDHSLNLLHTEEKMLQANASVTPINANIDTADIETLRDGVEPHLFAPQDKGAQKGTHLRGMIREAIRQELQGEIGNRLSRNLQQMIRHEIELTLRQMCEQE